MAPLQHLFTLSHIKVLLFPILRFKWRSCIPPYSSLPVCHSSLTSAIHLFYFARAAVPSIHTLLFSLLLMREVVTACTLQHSSRIIEKGVHVGGLCSVVAWLSVQNAPSRSDEDIVRFATSRATCCLVKGEKEGRYPSWLMSSTDFKGGFLLVLFSNRNQFTTVFQSSFYPPPPSSSELLPRL